MTDPGGPDMPIVDVRIEKMSRDRRPNWSKLTAAGIFRVPREGGRFGD